MILVELWRKVLGVSELIMEDLQKYRYELLDRGTGYDDRGTTTQKRVLSDVVDCEIVSLQSVMGGFQSSLVYYLVS